jgi:tetratricopeptide (TPR) repeat protein
VTHEFIDQICQELAALRKQGDNPERIGEIRVVLDEYFWKLAEKTVVGALGRKEGVLSFKKAEKLLLDAGLVDARLVNMVGGKFTKNLAREMAPGKGELDGVYYFSEWLNERYQSFLTGRAISKNNPDSNSLLRALERNAQDLAALRKRRQKLYESIGHLFVVMPGIELDVVKTVRNGDVDCRIEELAAAQAIEDARARKEGREPDTDAGDQARRFDQLVQRLLFHAREESADEEKLKCLEDVVAVRAELLLKVVRQARQNYSDEPEFQDSENLQVAKPDISSEEAVVFLQRELKLLRSLIRIGYRDGKMAKACSVLLTGMLRTTKSTVSEVFDLIKELDPYVEFNLDVLIAPFTGSGFFEWDRNTLVVALNPVGGAERAVVNAVANYRLLEDTFSGRVHIVEAYKKQFGKGFRERFLNDYSNWILSVSQGKKDALNEWNFQFFVEHIGPDPAGPPVPHGRGKLSPEKRNQEIDSIQRIMEADCLTVREAYTLAALLWEVQRFDEAIETLLVATGLAPDDCKVPYGLGLLREKKDEIPAARLDFEKVLRLAPNSLWGIYAQDALRRLG